MPATCEDRTEIRKLVCNAVLTHRPTVPYRDLMAIIDYTLEAVRVIQKAKE
jgi:hypothetical protein